MKFDYLLRFQKNYEGKFTLSMELGGGVRKTLQQDITLNRYKLTKDGRTYFKDILEKEVEVDKNERRLTLYLDDEAQIEEAAMLGYMLAGNGSIKRRKLFLERLD